jgi:hypothetical protein
MIRNPLHFLLPLSLLCACSDAEADPSGDDGTETDGTGTRGDTSDSRGETNGTTPTTGSPTDDDSSSADATDDGDTEIADTDDESCVDNSECTDPLTPFCWGGTCVACSDTPDSDDNCAALDASAPLCLGGQCVQCTEGNDAACEGDTPICDTEAQTCVGCTFHHQCPDSACHIAEGSCLPTDRVWTVGNGGNYTNVADALSQIGSGQVGTIIVNDGVYQGPFTISGDRVVAVLGGTGSPRLVSAINLTEPAFDITGATVYLQGLRLAANPNPETTIRVSGGQLWVDECTFRDIVYDGGNFTASQAGTGVRLVAASEMTMRNTTIGNVSNAGAAGIEVLEGSSATVLYSTIGTQSSSTTIHCSTIGTVDVRNSILAAQTTPAHACGDAEVVSTAVRPTVNTGWFVNYAQGNLHLSASGGTEFANVATWLTGDPPFDIDGQARPNVDGAPDFAGADVP